MYRKKSKDSRYQCFASAADSIIPYSAPPGPCHWRNNESAISNQGDRRIADELLNTGKPTLKVFDGQSSRRYDNPRSEARVPAITEMSTRIAAPALHNKASETEAKNP